MAKGGKRVGSGRPGMPGGGVVLCAKVPTELAVEFISICEARNTNKSQLLVTAVKLLVAAERKKAAEKANKSSQKE